MIITILGKQNIYGTSPKTGTKYSGALVHYSYDDVNGEQGKSFGTVYVSEMLCFADNIQIYSDYELEVDPVRKYATTFKLVELNSYFKRLAEKDSADQQHIVQADTHIN